MVLAISQFDQFSDTPDPEVATSNSPAVEPGSEMHNKLATK